MKINTQKRNSHLLGKNMGATLVRKVSENDHWTITTDIRRAELYNYRCVLPTSMVPGRTNSKRWKFASHTDGGCHTECCYPKSPRKAGLRPNLTALGC